jgi:RNA polymerase sigma-70 factor (ECF subfamily)
MTTSALSFQTGARAGKREASRSDDPDRDVIELIARGRDVKALRLVMARHGRSLYRYCHEQLRDAALAEDVLQQVFVSAHRGLAQFKGESTLRSWLFGIARHRVLDAARPLARLRACVDEAEAAELPDPRPWPDEVLDEQRVRDAVREALDELDEPVRTAVLLRYQQGFTFEAMAEICGEKPSTLQARVARAMPRLQARVIDKLARR